METLATTEEIIELSALRPWQQPHNEPPPPTSNHEDKYAPLFPCDAHLNSRIALWNGPIWTVKADAIVNSTYESLRDVSGLCRKIIDAAGKEIWTEYESAGQCRTGEAVLTRGCRLPATKIIHTVSPRYNAKYHNAAEHALHMCYRSVLSAAVEHKLRSVVFPCVYTKRKAYPRDEATHIAARSVRRFMEHYRDEFDLVVFCVDTLEDQLIYEALLPLYFPRTRQEQQRSVEMLATRDLGNEFGEPIIRERKIRIGESIGPGHNNQSDHDDAPSDDDDDDKDDEDTAVQSFCEMTADPDIERLERLQQLQQQRQRQLERANQSKLQALNYQAALAKAQQHSFDDLKKLRFLYNAGVDHSGAPVIVYMASRLPTSDVDLDRVMLFIIQTMDAVVDKRYSILYVHTDATDENQVTAVWLKRLFKTFSAKYQQNLAFFYMYEPSLWLKLLVLVAKGFVSSAFYKKIVYLSSPKDLGNVASRLDLPHYICPSKSEEDATSNQRSNDSTSSEAGHASTYGSAAVLFAHRSAAIM